jgi:hypothetical protein
MIEGIQIIGRAVMIAFAVVVVSAFFAMVDEGVNRELRLLLVVMGDLAGDWLWFLVVGLCLLGLAFLLRWALDRIYG